MPTSRSRFGALCTVAIVAAAALCAPTLAAQATTSTSPSAWVYVVEASSDGTSSWIYGYQADANGQLTAIPGSPFTQYSGDQVSIAVNSQYLFAVDGNTGSIDAYTIGSDGSLTFSHTTYVPSTALGCGEIHWAVPDHTGASLYIPDWETSSCTNWSLLSFSVDKSNGQLNYLNSAGNSQTFTAFQWVPLSFLGNNEFAYGTEGWSSQSIVGFQRNSDGSMTALNIHPPMPQAASGDQYAVWNPVAAGPNGNVAVAVQARDSSGNLVGNSQLAVYTADSSGNLTTNSTYANMPQTSSQGVTSMSMSPSGDLLAVGAGDGVQIFHFNGSNPITSDTALEESGTNPFQAMFWDNDDHLYATDGRSQLWVFTVTPTSFAVAPGAPYNLGSASMAVLPLPRASAQCSAPSADGINVCSPTEGASVTSPVSINAAATLSGGVYRFELWNGSTKLLSEDNGVMDQPLPLAAGSYKLIFDAYNTAGTHVYATRDITVSGGSGGGACSAPSTNGVNVCSPAEGASVSSPVSINAAATVSGGVYRFELWNGSTKLLSEDNGVMDQPLPLAAGSYKLIFDAYNTAGTHAYATRDITVSGGSGACTAPSSDGINVCAPANGATLGTTFTVSAAATVSGGVYRFELWTGSTKLATVRDGGTMDQSVSLSPGSYSLVFDAYNSAGAHVYKKIYVTIQ